jgi:hypothetical protein
MSSPPNPGFVKDFFNMETNEVYKCSIFNMKMILFILFLGIVFSCLFSSINAIFFDVSDEYEYGCDEIENLTMIGPINSVEIARNSSLRYDMAELTPSSENTSNLVNGVVKRIVHNDNGETTMYLDVDASLYIINGDPFGEDPAYKSLPNMMIQANTPMGETQAPYTRAPVVQLKKMDYIVYLMNDNGERVKLDSLNRDNDNIYKLRYKTQDQKTMDELLKYNIVSIVFTDYSKEEKVIDGRLKRRQ